MAKLTLLRTAVAIRTGLPNRGPSLKRQLPTLHPEPARWYSRPVLHSVQEESRLQLQKLRTQEIWFRKKLRAAFKRFPEALEGPAIYGRHHVYYEEGGSIYRMSQLDGEPEAEEVLCVDRWGAGGSVQRVRLSPGERLLAATVKSPGCEEASCVIVSLGRPPQILHTEPKVFSFEWATDNLLFYTSQETLQCRQVHRILLSAEGPESSVVYEEDDPAFFVEVSRSRDKQVLTINCSSKRSSEVRLIQCGSPLRPPTLLRPRRPGLLYHVEHSGGQLYILANTAPGNEYQLLRTALEGPGVGAEWEPVFSPARGDTLIDMEVLERHCVMALRGGGQRLHLDIIPLDDPSGTSSVKLPAWACALEPAPTTLTHSRAFPFVLSSPVRPPALFLFSPATRRLSLKEDGEGAPGADYSTTRVWAESKVPRTLIRAGSAGLGPAWRERLPHETGSTSWCHPGSSSLNGWHCAGVSGVQVSDGTLVPVTVFHRGPLDGLAGAPLLLHVYGAYGLDLGMTFRPEKRMLLDEGWTLAYCHVRGGGERGLGWHRAGSLENKRRGLEDLEACVRRLFELGVSRPALTALNARSAGAVLAGALCNEQPHLLRAVTLQAPFLDVLGTMQDPSLPLTVEERGEWGDPLADPQHYDSIASYCPYHNIRPQRYPSMLLTAYEGDQRVPLAGVRRYADRLAAAVQTYAGSLKEAESDPLPSIVLDVRPGGDHFGPEDLDRSLKEVARQFAFLYRELGIALPGQRERRR
ncbi:prolyl endopeptidase-like [Amia ocellicauda]|uniref:prolyl endopeptidase-like n=1 Tax=Amia ocellicauda TaxID=2972642 RepID=UPI003463AE9C